MSDRVFECLLDSPDSTESFAERIGKKLVGGEVIELISDLGGGKTTFVRGLARGLGSEDHVSSPTFTIGKQYRAGHIELHHFDFYRLHDPQEMRHELKESIKQKNAVTVVEWGAELQNVLPTKRLRIELEVTGPESRRLRVVYPKLYKGLIEERIKP